ncbi:hypothetical protein IWX91DRAFT_349628 [Phyllosticta citricarpa]
MGESFYEDGGVRCLNCGTKKEGLKKCMRCKKVKCCDVACQKQHWKEHRKECRAQEDTAADRGMELLCRVCCGLQGQRKVRER